MFNRGSGSGSESRRNDESFYRGIVVKNNDPAKMNRVKVYIPELSNQPYDEWLEKYDNINVKIPGVNQENSWENIEIFDEICKLIPWAEPCYPIMGESGNGRFYRDDTDPIGIITDANYSEGFLTNQTDFPTLSGGSFSPSFIYENFDTSIGDAFGNPVNNYSVKCNTLSFVYKSQKFSNKVKGMIGIPEVGAKVWVFHYLGNLQNPVYFGTMHDYRSLAVLNRNDNDENISIYYPNDFENV